MKIFWIKNMCIVHIYLCGSAIWDATNENPYRKISNRKRGKKTHTHIDAHSKFADFVSMRNDIHRQKYLFLSEVFFLCTFYASLFLRSSNLVIQLGMKWAYDGNTKSNLFNDFRNDTISAVVCSYSGVSSVIDTRNIMFAEPKATSIDTPWCDRIGQIRLNRLQRWMLYAVSAVKSLLTFHIHSSRDRSDENFKSFQIPTNALFPRLAVTVRTLRTLRTFTHMNRSISCEFRGICGNDDGA